MGSGESKGQSMRNTILPASFAVAAATLLLALSASAQVYGPSTEGRRSAADMKAAAAAPKPAYDPRDLSGVWYGRGSILNGGSWPAFTAAGKKLFDANKPSYGPRAVAPA